MLLSLNLIKSASEYYEKHKSKIEGYANLQQAGNGTKDGLTYVIIIFSTILFVIELLLVIYALRIAYACSAPGYERLVHISLALFFTFPYLLISVFLAPCAKKLK